MSEHMPAVYSSSGLDDATIDENDRMIRKTQWLRERALLDITPGGAIPKSPEDRAFFLSLIDGSARTALASKKIKSDEKSAHTQAALTQAIVEAVNLSSVNRPKRERVKTRSITHRELNTVPGHTSVGVIPVPSITIT